VSPRLALNLGSSHPLASASRFSWDNKHTPPCLAWHKHCLLQSQSYSGQGTAGGGQTFSHATLTYLGTRFGPVHGTTCIYYHFCWRYSNFQKTELGHPSRTSSTFICVGEWIRIFLFFLFFSFLFFFCGTGVWTQGLHLKPLHQPPPPSHFFLWVFQARVSQTLSGLALNHNPPDLCILSR
jgi:hypothetical protein